MNFKTYTPKKSEIKKNWFIIDARNLVVGRLASLAAKILRGKHKVCYSTNLDCGDNLIIINADFINFTGNKFNDKIYYKHTGFVGGLKECTPHDLNIRNKNEQIIKLAILRMMGLNGPLSRKRMKNLYVYKNDQHKNSAQKPIAIDVSALSRKNSLNAC